VNNVENATVDVADKVLPIYVIRV